MAQQVQAKQRELQSKLEAMLASVEDERLRPMRKQGFLAMAKCCDLSDPSAPGVRANSRRQRRRDARRERRRRHEPTLLRHRRDASHARGPRRTAYQQCLQKAQLPEQRASQVVQGELNDFQSRLQRAIATCQDDVKDGLRAASDQISLRHRAEISRGSRRWRANGRITPQAATPTRTARRTSSTRASERSSTRTRLCSATSRSASRRDYVS